MLNFLAAIGKRVLSTLSQIGGIFILLKQTLFWMFVGPFIKRPISHRNVFQQMVFEGVNSLLIVFFVTFFTGIVLAMQSAYQLAHLSCHSYSYEACHIHLCS